MPTAPENAKRQLMVDPAWWGENRNVLVERWNALAAQVTRIRWTNGLLLLPALAWLGLLFVYPIGRLFYASLFTPAFSLSSYAKLLGTSVYAKVFANTFEISATVTLLALVLGYPLAFVLATAGPRASRLMLGAIIVPLWTSVLVRTYAWMVLLGRRGLVNEGLQSLGLLDAPLPLLYNRLGVTIGMVHVLLPFMVLPIYSVMKGIDVDLLKAAQNLGPIGARRSCESTCRCRYRGSPPAASSSSSARWGSSSPRLCSAGAAT